MDAHALLSAQGWRGAGHSLHKTDDSIGLSKPIPIAKKVGTKGLGNKQHFTSDQWWLNAFDEQLKGLDTSQKGKVVQTVTTGKLNTIGSGALAKYSVYATFVRGGFLEGTIVQVNDGESDATNTNGTATPADHEPRKETREERRARKEARRLRKAERARRRAAKIERRAAKTARAEAKAEAKKEKKLEKQRRRARKEEKRRQRQAAKDTPGK